MSLSLQEGGKFWSGLEGSSRDYAWVQMATPLFEAGSVPLAIPLVHRLPFTALMYIAVLTAAVGGAIYALAESILTVFIGRGLMGVASQFSASVIHSYIGEMGTVMDDIRKKQGKKPLKFTFFIVLSFMLNGGLLLPYGMLQILCMHDKYSVFETPNTVRHNITHARNS